jgi:hypothetical protein
MEKLNNYQKYLYVKEAEERLQSHLDNNLICLDTIVRYASVDKLWPTSGGAKRLCRKYGLRYAKRKRVRK